MKKEIKNSLLILCSCLMMAFNVTNFARVGDLLPGGFTGVSLLIKRVLDTFCHMDVSYTLISVLLNAIPIVIAFRYMGKKFATKTVIVVVLTAVLVDIMPNFHITEDMVLCALFGGVLNGAAIGISLRAEASNGGSELISMFISKHYGRDAWNYIFAGNCIVLIISGFLFGLTGALYSIILQFVSTLVIQNIYKRYQKMTLIIVTDKPDEVYAAIKRVTQHDATLLKGTGMYGQEEHAVLYSVIASDEIERVNDEITAVDSEAFVNSFSSDLLSGQFFRRPFE